MTGNTPTEQDKSFASAVIRLKLADESSVDECMKTVADDEAPSLADAMVERGLLDREGVERVLRETTSEAAPGGASDAEKPEIPGYEMLSKRGEGGMGCVWKARQASLDRFVAIKILPPLFSRSKKFIERFRREALATAKLNHPNIVSAVDVNTVRHEGAPDLHYFVMEYVDGESLEDVMGRTGKVKPLRAARIAAEVAAGLDHAWTKAGIVHRDIKPANILFARDGKVKVADLGLARCSWEDAGLTTAGLALGTPHYASPEQAQGKAEIDTRSDIYALGATLFHMLTGRTVFQGESAAAVMAKHVTEDAPFCTDVDASIPAALSAVVARMMRRNPAERYQTAGELRVDLERFLEHERPLAYTLMLDADAGSQSGFISRPPEVFPVEEAERARRKRGSVRHWPHALAATLFVAALGLWLGVQVSRNDRPGSEERPGPGAVAQPGPISVWFDVSDPASVVGPGGSFPLNLSSTSGVRLHVKPDRATHVFIVMVSGERGSGAVRLKLLSPENAEPRLLAKDARGEFPAADRFYSLPPAVTTVAFIVATSAESAERSDVAASLARISADLSAWAGAGRALAEGIPRGETLWYGNPDEKWTAGGDDGSVHETAAVLETACEKIRGIFGGKPVIMCGAAASCSAD